jgi:hypothetical protein
VTWRVAGVGGIFRGLALGAALAGGLALTGPGCFVQRLTTPRLTGTCEGACDHYAACRPDADRGRCLLECPEVFSDDESLRAYESLACPAAVEYVDGAHPRAASR